METAGKVERHGCQGLRDDGAKRGDGIVAIVASKTFGSAPFALNSYIIRMNTGKSAENLNHENDMGTTEKRARLSSG